MKNYSTITGRKLSVSSNNSSRTFTIRTDSFKYRTTRMSKQEFNESLSMTGNDWQHFLNSTSDYYKVSK